MDHLLMHKIQPRIRTFGPPKKNSFEILHRKLCVNSVSKNVCVCFHLDLSDPPLLIRCLAKH